MLVGWGRGVGLLCLPPCLGVSDGLGCLHLDTESGAGRRGGCGVGGWDGLGVGLGGRRVGVVQLVGAGVLTLTLVVIGVRGRWVVVVLGVRGVAHGWSTLGRGSGLRRRFVSFP